MFTTPHLKTAPTVLALSMGLTFLLAGCSDGGTGSLTIGVADAPVDSAQQVVVEFTGVEVHGAAGSSITIDYSSPKTIDLLALQGGLRELLLEGQTLDTGQYSWIRLAVNAEADGVLDSYIVTDTGSYELRIPSGSESGLKLNTPFTIYEDRETDFTVDFDLRQSVHNPDGQTGPLGAVYLLRPTLRLLDSNETGRIAGTLDPAIFNGLSCSANVGDYAVYAYSGSDVTPDDVDGSEPDPVNTAMVEYSNNAYRYTVSFLEPGDYTVAATCDADGDDPAQDDAISFVGTANVSVTAGGDSSHNFAP